MSEPRVPSGFGCRAEPAQGVQGDEVPLGEKKNGQPRGVENPFPDTCKKKNILNLVYKILRSNYHSSTTVFMNNYVKSGRHSRVVYRREVFRVEIRETAGT